MRSNRGAQYGVHSHGTVYKVLGILGAAFPSPVIDEGVVPVGSQLRSGALRTAAVIDQRIEEIQLATEMTVTAQRTTEPRPSQGRLPGYVARMPAA